MITFPPYMIPVKTEHGEGFILYVSEGGAFENDCFCVVLKETGKLKHYKTLQITIEQNLTYGIKNT